MPEKRKKKNSDGSNGDSTSRAELDVHPSLYITHLISTSCVENEDATGQGRPSLRRLSLSQPAPRQSCKSSRQDLVVEDSKKNGGGTTKEARRNITSPSLYITHLISTSCVEKRGCDRAGKTEFETVIYSVSASAKTELQTPSKARLGRRRPKVHFWPTAQYYSAPLFQDLWSGTGND